MNKRLKSINIPPDVNCYDFFVEYAETYPPAASMLEAYHTVFRKFKLPKKLWRDTGDMLWRFTQMVIENEGVQLDTRGWNKTMANYVHMLADMYEALVRVVEEMGADWGDEGPGGVGE